MPGYIVMKLAKFALTLLLLALPQLALSDGKLVETPYKPQKVVFDFYFDQKYNHPSQIINNQNSIGSN